MFDVEAHGIYGGFWRDLYKFGPVVIDTVGGDLGVFIDNEIKVGFSFATLVGLISGNEDDDVFDAVNGSYGRPVIHQQRLHTSILYLHYLFL